MLCHHLATLEKTFMKNYLALTLILATAVVGLSTPFTTSASAAEIRDHRGPVIVIPPRPHLPPVVIIDPPIFQPPVVVQPTEPPHQVSGLSCKQAKRIVKRNGFHHVQISSCNKPNYIFFGNNENGYFRITVNMQGDLDTMYFGYM
jgi:hypothetical protein